MVDVTILHRLYTAFPKALLNHNLELVVSQKENTYFLLADCETEEDVIAKLLEWLSRAAFKTEPYRSRTANKRFHAYHLDGINQFCGTSFTVDDMDEIYTYLGNCVNHPKTLKFIRSGYDMSVLYEPRGGASDA